MVEKQAYDKEESELKGGTVKETLPSTSISLLERVTELLVSFSEEVPGKTSGDAIPRITEVEIIGSLNAFLNNLAKDINVLPEYSIKREKDSRNYRADFFLETDKEKLIIEIKNPLFSASKIISSGTDQLLNYLTASSVSSGILYIPPLMKDEKLEVVKITKAIGKKIYNIVQIFPKKRLNKSMQ